jgi:hypothetical protein
LINNYNEALNLKSQDNPELQNAFTRLLEEVIESIITITKILVDNKLKASTTTYTVESVIELMILLQKQAYDASNRNFAHIKKIFRQHFYDSYLKGMVEKAEKHFKDEVIITTLKTLIAKLTPIKLSGGGDDDDDGIPEDPAKTVVFIIPQSSRKFTDTKVILIQHVLSLLIDAGFVIPSIDALLEDDVKEDVIAIFYNVLRNSPITFLHLHETSPRYYAFESYVLYHDKVLAYIFSFLQNFSISQARPPLASGGAQKTLEAIVASFSKQRKSKMRHSLTSDAKKQLKYDTNKAAKMLLKMRLK